jgi:SNW domain-containing protein 1
MTSIAEGLFKSLPKPKYTGEDEEVPQHAQPRGPRIVGADQIDESQIVLRVGKPVSTLENFFHFNYVLIIYV